MDNFTRKVELFSNLAIIFVALLLGVVLVKKYLLTQLIPLSNDATVNSAINIGTKIDVQDVDWSTNHQTLVLALSNTCHYCSESAPFYRRLAQSKGGTSLLAVLPQPVEDGQKYLEKLSVSVNEVRQSLLANIGVQGTPTLILMDNKGTIIDSWVGKLSTDEETEVLSKLEQHR